MVPANWPNGDPADRRLLSCRQDDPTVLLGTVRDLPARLDPGDLLVVNDAATLPASLQARRDDGQRVELRLVRSLPDGTWLVTVFGQGSWREDTDVRPVVADLMIGERLSLSPIWSAEVIQGDARHGRTAEVRFNLAGGPFWHALYQHGRPIQYRHVADDLPLWEVQTPFASRPWASEMPSAGQPLTWSVLLALRRRGVVLATLTHAAGISATGAVALDASLPWPERYDLPVRTVAAIARTRQAGGRVIAVGTSVVRALEGCAAVHGGQLRPGEGETDYRIGPATRRRIVDGLLTGMHEPTASHYDLLQAFAPIERWRSLYARAEAAGFRSHEFGDLSLIISPLAPATTGAAKPSPAARCTGTSGHARG